MVLYLILSAVAAGIIATSVMVAILYLPLLWRRPSFDVLGAMGSVVTHLSDGRARVLGALFYFAGGIFFAFFYGWVALALMRTELSVPELTLLPGWPLNINLVYPFLGAAIGLAHGVIVALLLTIFVSEQHPLDEYRDNVPLALSQVVSHLVYGVTVMFFHHQFLQLFLGLNG